MNTSTLVVDNLVVRNSVQMPDNGGEDQSDIEYKIFGTNEET
jgi:hypothetical protein